MTRIIFGEIPVQGVKATFPDPHQGPVWIPAIHYETIFFILCDVCGNQVTGGRAKRGLSTSCPDCNKKRTDTWAHQTLQKERETIGERPLYFWWKIRQECFERDNYICQQTDGQAGNICGKDIRTDTKPGEAHHIIPLSQGGSNQLTNLSTRCFTHHKEEHSMIGNIKRKHVSLSAFGI